LLGSVRASAQVISYEAALGMTTVMVVLVTGSLSTRAIVASQSNGFWNWNLIRLGFLPFIFFMIAITAELTRPPFDLTEADTELVGGFHTEYSSIRFGLFYLAEFMNTITMSAIVVTLFFGGPNGYIFHIPGATIYMPIIYFLLKTVAFCFIYVWFRAALPRLRYDQLMDLGWKRLIPLTLGWLLLVAAIVAWGWAGLFLVPVVLLASILLIRANKLDVGFFAQHQVDDLDASGTPYTHVAGRMPGAHEAKIRARVARIGFSGGRADTSIGQLSGGEKARLLMGLATFEGPQLLILDEPTNHLDIDSRGELIEAINDYEGACILVSHDRRLLEACVDRLWLTANGTVKPFEGDLADYGRFVLGADARPAEARKREPASPAPAARPKREPAPLKRELQALEDKVNRFHDLLRRVDAALAQASAQGGDAGKIADLAEKRVELERALTASEQAWFELSAEAEGT